jgi:hypothetical protein
MDPIIARLRQIPSGSLVPVEWLCQELERAGASLQPEPEPANPAGDGPPLVTWREKLWTVPAETRIGVHELTEALGKPRSWVYRHTSPKAAEAAGYPLIPHRKLEGELIFVVGELRAWIRDNEEIIRAGRMESTLEERRSWSVSETRRRKGARHGK